MDRSGLGRRDLRVLLAMLVTVAVAQALADGAPASWGVPAVAALSGAVGATANAWAVRLWDARSLVRSA